jgi:hypothetical protein
MYLSLRGAKNIWECFAVSIEWLGVLGLMILIPCSQYFIIFKKKLSLENMGVISMCMNNLMLT